MQFDWLLACQSKYDVEICLSCIIRHPEDNKIKIDMGESKEAFEGNFDFSVREASKDLSQNGKLIVLKPEQEAAIRDKSVDRMSLQSIKRK